MTIHALVTGTLWEAPGQHTSKNGNSFVGATVKVRDGNDSQWVKLLAFGTDAQDALMRLDAGDSVSAQGVFKADIYAPPNRDPRVNLTIFVDAVLPLRAPPKPKKAKPKKEAPAPSGGAWDDDVPFGWLP